MARLFLFDNRASNVVSRSLLPGPPDVYRVTGGGESLSTLVTELTPALRAHPKHGLMLVAHGNAGDLQFTADHLNRGTVGQLSAWRTFIGGSVQIHGCGVASAVDLQLYVAVAMNMGQQRATDGSLAPPYMNLNIPIAQAAQTGDFDSQTNRAIRSGRGVQFLIAFANAIGLPVTGAVHAQEPDAAWRYTGPTVTASPGGSLVLQVPRGSAGFDSHTEGSFVIGY